MAATMAAAKAARQLSWTSRTAGAVQLLPSWSVTSLLPTEAELGAALDAGQVARLAALASLRVDPTVEAATTRALSDVVLFCRQVSKVSSARSRDEDGMPENAVSVVDLPSPPPAPAATFDALATAPRRDGQYLLAPKHAVLG